MSNEARMRERRDKKSTKCSIFALASIGGPKYMVFMGLGPIDLFISFLSRFCFPVNHAATT